MIATEDCIWGVQDKQDAETITDNSRIKADDVSLRRSIASFLQSQIQSWNPDLVIVVERKGTAVLRAVMEAQDPPIAWEWKDVVSSKVVTELKSELRKKRILVFDDMMKRGAHLAELLRDLRDECGVDITSPECIRVAVFAVHEESSRGREIEGTLIPHAWYRRGLTTSSYTSMRTAIVRMLQRCGSLMLDTEHMEVRLKLTGSFDQFVQALRRTGRAMIFNSAESRENITVLYEDDEIHRLPLDDLPKGTTTDNIVKKCRVVGRPGNEFALIPICFPKIPANQAWEPPPEVVKLLGDSVRGEKATDIARFYGAGMRAALRVLRWVLKDLYAAAPHEFTLSLPGHSCDVAGGGYHLEHLKVMYPTLDVDFLNKWIAKIEREAQSEASRLHKVEPLSVPLLTDNELNERALWLLQEIAASLDRKRIALYWKGKPEPKHPFGLTASEIFEIAQRFRWEKVTTSTLFDLLIDEATLVTHVQPVAREDGNMTIERTFEPDGEIVSEAIRRYTTQWGLPDAGP
jgi:hypothetical protein